jgi:hypothetical protein
MFANFPFVWPFRWNVQFHHIHVYVDSLKELSEYKLLEERLNGAYVCWGNTKLGKCWFFGFWFFPHTLLQFRCGMVASGLEFRTVCSCADEGFIKCSCFFLMAQKIVCVRERVRARICSLELDKYVRMRT